MREGQIFLSVLTKNIITISLNTHFRISVTYIYQLVCGNELVEKLFGSIVTETLKNGILMPIDISKELAYYVTD